MMTPLTTRIILTIWTIATTSTMNGKQHCHKSGDIPADSMDLSKKHNAGSIRY